VRARTDVALQAGEDIHGPTVDREMVDRHGCGIWISAGTGIGAEPRADLGKGARQVAFDDLDVGGAREDGRAGKALEQYRGAVEVIEVRVRDENSREAPALRRDALR
jgi:hypothetical protein